MRQNIEACLKKAGAVLSRTHAPITTLIYDHGDWFQSLDLYTQAGLAKYSGGYVVGHDFETGDWNFMHFGRVDPERGDFLRKVVTNKLCAFCHDRNILASLEVRDISPEDPLQKVWAGAFRSLHAGAGFGVTGYPEIVDHILMALCLNLGGHLSHRECTQLLSADHVKVVEAQEFAGLNREDYGELLNILTDMVGREYPRLD